MLTASGDQDGRARVAVTFEEEADWCRAKARVMSSKREEQLLLRIASAFDDLHASVGGVRTLAHDGSR